MKILAIETSCDETAISVLEIKKNRFSILSNIVSSQVKLHAKWGGVVPNLAKREHQRNLPLVLKRALARAGITNPEKEIDLLAVTQGPGLEPALWVGLNFAKELSVQWRKPVRGINHLEGHFFSVFLRKNGEFSISNFQFPIIVLLVSGGHTELVLVRDFLKYKSLGGTRDDAAGEAFDKVAKMLGLGYPGGPVVAKLASQYDGGRTSIILKIDLPRPMIDDNSLEGRYDFSFSGLKTAVLYKIREIGQLTPEVKKEICAEFQQAVLDVLIKKTLRAAGEHGVKTIVVAGGVSANKELRKQFKEATLKSDRGYVLLLPEVKFAGDNAAMIALAAWFRQMKNPTVGRLGFADGNLRL